MGTSWIRLLEPRTLQLPWHWQEGCANLCILMRSAKKRPPAEQIRLHILTNLQQFGWLFVIISAAPQFAQLAGFLRKDQCSPWVDTGHTGLGRARSCSPIGLIQPLFGAWKNMHSVDIVLHHCTSPSSSSDSSWTVEQQACAVWTSLKHLKPSQTSNHFGESIFSEYSNIDDLKGLK